MTRTPSRSTLGGGGMGGGGGGGLGPLLADAACCCSSGLPCSAKGTGVSFRLAGARSKSTDLLLQGVLHASEPGPAPSRMDTAGGATGL
jgi:hypothetical protein